MPMALIRGYPGAKTPVHQATGHTHTYIYIIYIYTHTHRAVLLYTLIVQTVYPY